MEGCNYGLFLDSVFKDGICKLFLDSSASCLKLNGKGYISFCKVVEEVLEGRYLVGKRAATVFSAAFVVFLLIGAIMTARPLVRTIDFILLVMCILTLSAILRQRKRIFFLSRDLIGGK